MIVLVQAGPTGIEYCLVKDNKRTVRRTGLDLDLLKEKIQQDAQGVEIAVFGYRVENGGDRILRSVMDVAPSLIANLGEEFQIDMDSDHVMKDCINFCRRHFVVSRHVLLCESAFLRALPEHARRFAIRDEKDDQTIRRCGRHGLAHEWALDQCRGDQKVLGPRTITLFLGDRSNLIALQDGAPQASSDGFSEIDGVVSSYGAGLIDTSIVFQLLSSGKSCEEVKEILSTQSGLLALAGTPCHLEDILTRKDAKAGFAREILTYQILKYIGSCAAVLGGVDTILFVGEPGAGMKDLIEDLLAGMSFLGVQPSSGSRRSKGITQLTGKDSGITAYYLPYDRWQVMEDLLERGDTHAAGEAAASSAISTRADRE